MKEIPLTQGKVAMVDDTLYDYLIQFHWTYQQPGYAIRYVKGQSINIRMHDTVYTQLYGDHVGFRVDHKDFNGLNNQGYNLRLATIAQNAYHSKKYRNNTSGFRGVSFKTLNNKWQAKIIIDQRHVYLGLHETAKDAARAYDKAAHAHAGEFATLNFPNEYACH